MSIAEARTEAELGCVFSKGVGVEDAGVYRESEDKGVEEMAHEERHRLRVDRGHACVLAGWARLLLP